MKLFFIFSLIICSYVNFISASEDLYNSFISIDIREVDNGAIKIAIKDNIDVANQVTSAGSLALVSNYAKNDAFLISKLKGANYSIYGKTNLSEWANFRSFNSVSGWSSVGGQTINPYGMNRNPCGSSSGSAVAVASGMIDIAIGTETNGSISCPASVNGIVGMKPTVGLVSRNGIVPISASQDTAGPMGNSVAIVAKTLEVIAGKDPEDEATYYIPNNFKLTPDLDKNSLKGKRFGLLNSGMEDEEGKRLLDKAIKIIKSAGGEVVIIKDERVYPGEEELFLLLYEFKRDLEKYLKGADTPYKSLQSLIDFNNANKDMVMPHFNQEIFEASLEASSKHNEYKVSLKMINTVRYEFDQLLDQYDLDAFVGLTRNPAWEIVYEGGDSIAMDRQRSWGNGGFAAIAGYPHITLPLDEVDGLPAGLSFIGTKWTDISLLEYAATFERWNRRK
jgi:Asp-tRNA(Asn)/Glu-tRNA(Gln) amidotransferase A subunit family amidase